MTPALPEFVQIEPVGRCNLACRMCPVRLRDVADSRDAFLPLATFERLLAQFPDVKELHLQGLGEPLMHPRFFDLVRHAVERGIEVSTNSNLTLLSARRASECVASGLARIHVSLDAATPAIYEWIRVGARFGRVLRGFERLLAAKAQAASSQPDVQLVAVAMRRNLADLPNLVRLAHALGLRALSVQHLCHDFGESTLPGRYVSMRDFVAAETLVTAEPGLVERSFDDTAALAAALGVSLRLPRPVRRTRPPRSRGCDWPWRGAYLSFRGEAMPCCMVATPDRACFGNMAVDGVAPVWGNAAYADFRRRLESPDPPEICRSCAVYAGTF